MFNFVQSWLPFKVTAFNDGFFFAQQALGHNKISDHYEVVGRSNQMDTERQTGKRFKGSHKQAVTEIWSTTTTCDLH